MSNCRNLPSSALQQLFLNDTPLMDVRAPVEFASGAFPTAFNCPLLDDEQRAEVGTVYAESGQQAAVNRGLELASEGIRKNRLASWTDFVNRHPHGYLYCFRGGLRSHTTQTWLSDAGLDYPLIEGGYKSMRRFLLDSMKKVCESNKIIVLAGATANGKTAFLNNYQHSVDLEGLANHRGSAFGSTFSPQPAQSGFENALAIALLKLEDAGAPLILVEAESRLIGRLNLPLPLQEAMRRAPVIELRSDRRARILRLRNDYIDYALRHFATNCEDPWKQLEEYVQGALSRIRKRLGGNKYAELSALLPEACVALQCHDNWSGFDRMFSELLDHYYDKMYAYQLEKQKQQRIFSGLDNEVLTFLENHYAQA